MDDSAARTKVDWREWGAAAFEEARETDRPVLLSLSATWCEWCHEMDETTFSRPTIAANVNERFVPVRVDIDRQPRVRERYNMGGFPSTVFATPDGEVLSGATYLGVDGMRQVLERVGEAWDEKGADAGRIPRSLRESDLPTGEVTADVEAHMAGQLTDKFDERHGGWGDDAKFPLPRTVEFALKREREQALSTLQAVRLDLFDDYGGGFFRYASTRDWSDPHYEKLLDANAALVRAYANAYLYTGRDDYRDPARETIEYLTTTLWTGEAFAGSQDVGAGEDYYGRSPSERESAEPPSVDPTAFADGNALAVDALLTYVAYTDDGEARRYAERALDYLTTELVDDGAVAHYDGDDAETGLLTDQARVLGALTRAAQVLGDDGRLDAATAVADHAIETLRTDEGAFADGPVAGPGLLDRPMYPLDANAELADALVDLSVLTGESRYRKVARDALAAFAGAHDRFSVQVAGYATAASRVASPPLVVAVADDAGSDLHRAALRVADHEKIVVPNATGEQFDAGNAYVVIGDRTSDPAATPGELGERIASLVDEAGANGAESYVP